MSEHPGTQFPNIALALPPEANSSSVVASVISHEFSKGQLSFEAYTTSIQVDKSTQYVAEVGFVFVPVFTRKSSPLTETVPPPSLY